MSHPIEFTALMVFPLDCGDGWQAAVDIELRVHCCIIPGEPEYRPPLHRPDLYDPGAAPELDEILAVEIAAVRRAPEDAGRYWDDGWRPVPLVLRDAVMAWLAEPEQVSAILERANEQARWAA